MLNFDLVFVPYLLVNVPDQRIADVRNLGGGGKRGKWKIFRDTVLKTGVEEGIGMAFQVGKMNLEQQMYCKNFGTC